MKKSVFVRGYEMKRRPVSAGALPAMLLLLVVGGACTLGETHASDVPNGDTSLVGRLYEQLPRIEPFDEVTGAAAIRYFRRVALERPGVAEVFRELASTAACARRHGAAATKAYLRADDAEVLGVVVVTDSGGSGAAARVITACFFIPRAPSGLRQADPVSDFTPCLTRYYYGVATSDRYFLLVAGTAPWSCDRLLERHAAFDPEPFDVA